MTLCPQGHESVAADYCDRCGLRIGGPPMTLSARLYGDSATRQPQSSPSPASPSPASPRPASPRPASPRPASPGPSCPRCGVPGFGKFCESCGYSDAPPPLVRWTAVVTASRAYYAAVMATAAPSASGVRFPDSCPERTFPLSGSRMRIGRRSASREQVPEIDLSGPPADPGVSRLHAILVAQPDGTWAVVDPGSENGTTVNDVDITPGHEVALQDGDVIQMGAWTSILIVADA